MAGKNTGFGTAAFRAIETKSPNALINDHIAELLAQPSGFAWANNLPNETWQLMKDLLAVRTRIIDDLCVGWIKKDISQYATLGLGNNVFNTHTDNLQIVILGAGMDTRAFRLRDIKNCSIFEVDYSETITYKSRVLGENNIFPLSKSHFFIPHDLACASLRDSLIFNKFNPDITTLWILEALTGYLTELENHSLIEQITSLSSPTSVAISTFIGNTKEAYGSGTGNSKRHKFFTDSGSQLFCEYGWSAKQMKLGHFAKMFDRDKLLSDYDYWIVCAVR